MNKKVFVIIVVCLVFLIGLAILAFKQGLVNTLLSGASSYCIDQYDPVCGVDGKTYSNSCYAAVANTEIAYKGECKKDNDKPACLTQYDPVCGDDGKTYPNSCNATVAHVEIAYKGECKEGSDCLAQYDPVCGTDGKTYSNTCVAEKQFKVPVACQGACPCQTQKCSEGTSYGQCSQNPPRFCDNGQLTNKCSVCGCPTDQVCQDDGTCKIETQKCSNGTPYNSCGVTKPHYCENGTNINKCSSCGCPDNQTCQADGSCLKISEEAYFQFSMPPDTDTFIIKLTDPDKIQEARDILSGKQTYAISIMGKIIKAPVDYNPSWHFHLDPSTISFFDYAIEVCDADMQYVEDHLNEVGGSFLPGSQWCPWASELVSEIELSQIATKIEQCQVGTRTATQYCDNNKTLKDQLVVKSLCQADYQCQTNLCPNGQCANPGFFVRVGNWFGGLFQKIKQTL